MAKQVISKAHRKKYKRPSAAVREFEHTERKGYENARSKFEASLFLGMRTRDQLVARGALKKRATKLRALSILKGHLKSKKASFKKLQKMAEQRRDKELESHLSQRMAHW